jgi:hypothetical protein
MKDFELYNLELSLRARIKDTKKIADSMDESVLKDSYEYNELNSLVKMHRDVSKKIIFYEQSSEIKPHPKKAREFRCSDEALDIKNKQMEMD